MPNWRVSEPRLYSRCEFWVTVARYIGEQVMLYLVREVVRKLEVDLHPGGLIVLPLANGNTLETTPISDQVFASDFATRDQNEMISDGYRWESNPERSDTLTPRGHSVFPRIAIKGTEPDLLLPYPAVPSNAPACPALWSLFGH